MRVAIGAVWHETLTFAHTRTALDDFKRFQLSEGDEVIARNRGVRNEIGGFIDVAGAHGMDVIPLVFAGALPSATVSRDAYRHIRTRLADCLHRSVPVDGVLLALHGAMVAEDVDDVEADLLALVRGIIGKDCPLVATLDFHANLSESAVTMADVLVGYDTYPHTDIYERGVEAVKLLEILVRGAPVARAYRKLPLLTVPQAQGTDDQPMSRIMERVHEMECTLPLWSATVCAGYPYADVERLGVAVVAYSKGESSVAETCVEELARLIWDLRREFTVRNTSVGEAVRQAIDAPAGPVVLVDVADNIGGGTPGDGTAILQELLRQSAAGAVVTIADTASVAAAVSAGVGNRVPLSVGGKFDGNHGSSVPVEAYVRLLSDGIYTHRGSYMTGLRAHMGRAAVVVADGVEIVLTERKALPFDAEQLRSVGIEPASRKMIVVKSALAWKAAYGSLARRIIYVDTPGLCSSNLFSFPFRKVSRPMFPLDEATSL